MIEFLNIFNTIYIFDKDELKFKFKPLINYNNKYVCIDRNERDILLNIKDKVKYNDTYLLYLTNIEIIYGINNIDNILNLTNDNIDDNLLYYKYSVNIEKKENLVIDNNEICYLCLEKFLQELNNNPIIKSDCSHYICEDCSKTFFNINDILEVGNARVNCGICRNEYSFSDCTVYI
jgi:hypothetical protein